MYQNEPSKLQKVLRAIWPFIYKALNNTIFFLLSTIKAFIKEMIRMIKTGGIGE